MLKNRNMLSLLHTFETAALYMSFTLTAKAMNLTQGAVSQRIRHLEASLGFRLFIRMTRRLTLTEEGERLLAVLSSSLKRINDEIEDIRAQSLRGTLSLGLPPTFAFLWLVPRLSEFTSLWPGLNINFRVRAGVIDFNIERVDAAIYYSNQKYSDLYCERLMDEILIPVCSPSLAEQISDDPCWMERIPFIHTSESVDSQNVFSEWRDWCTGADISLPFSDNFLSFNNCQMAVETALIGSGIAMGRKHLLKNYLSEGKLVTPFTTEVTSGYGYDLIIPRENVNRPGIRAFRQWIKEINGAWQ